MSASATLSTISLHQPWATLLVHGAKRIETRGFPWGRPLPSVLAIHAAKRWNGELYQLSRREPFHSALAALGWSWPAVGGQRMPTPRGLTLGGVVGLVRIVECLPTGGRLAAYLETEWVAGLSEQERAFGDYSPGRWGWRTDARVAFAEAIPLRGFQSVWQWAAPRAVLDAAAALAGEASAAAS